MKKFLSVFLIVSILISLLTLNVFAKEKIHSADIELKSNIAGLDYNDYEKIAIIKSDSIKFNDSKNCDCIILSDYAGNLYFDKLKPGRTYYIQYSFIATDGYELPESKDDLQLNTVCDKGCQEIWYGIAHGTDSNYGPQLSIMLNTKVTVDGNFFQRFFGKIADTILKIKAWAPY